MRVRGRVMDVVFDRVAGLDIGKKLVVVCVRTPGERGRRVSQIRTFRTMTRHVHVLGDWLVEEGVKVAAAGRTPPDLAEAREGGRDAGTEQVPGGVQAAGRGAGR